MEMPKPGAGHKKIAQFNGTWTGEETMHPSQWDPKGGVAQGTTTSRAVCGGFYIVSDYAQRRNGAVTFEGHSVMSFDEKSQEVLLHWFDSMGTGAEVFRGKFAGEKLTLSCQNFMGHHRLTHDMSEKDTRRTRMEMSTDGKQYSTLFEGVYHQKT